MRLYPNAVKKVLGKIKMRGKQFALMKKLD